MRGRKPAPRRGRAQPSGELHTHQPHTATTVEMSADGRRALVASTAVDTVEPAIPSWHVEDLETTRALDGPDFSYFLGDDGAWVTPGPLLPGESELGDDGIRMAGQTAEMPPQEAVGNFERWANAVSTPRQ